jgi:hypothetical protein
MDFCSERAMPDHVHMLLSVPPKFSIAHTIGYLKGKSAIRIHRTVLKTKGTLFGRSFWAKGYCVSQRWYRFIGQFGGVFKVDLAGHVHAAFVRFLKYASSGVL